MVRRLATLFLGLVLVIGMMLAGPATAGGACTETGTDTADNLRGTSGNDIVCARGGDDRLAGRGGDDRMRGEGGRDLLIGGSGGDALKGGEDGDTLIGGPGLDRLAGGSVPTSSTRAAAARTLFAAGADWTSATWMKTTMFADATKWSKKGKWSKGGCGHCHTTLPCTAHQSSKPARLGWMALHKGGQRRPGFVSWLPGKN